MKPTMKSIVFAFVLAGCPLFAGGITGNWVVEEPRGDGTTKRTYYNLTQQPDGKISGTVRSTQFVYSIVDGRGTPERFIIFGSMKDGASERKRNFEGGITESLKGDTISIGEVRDGGANGMIGTLATGHRAPAGEGAMPARIELPALHKVRDNGLARTPPMGWNSWNKFNRKIDDATVRGVADAIAKNGMKDAGYIYITIDDTWEGERDAQGVLHSNNKFPDMKALADYVHSKGLKLGIYSSPGPNTCEGYEGSYGHEAQDAKTWAAWGIDYLKYDWCGARNIYTEAEMQAVYQKMGDALLAAGRPIVYSLCQYGRQDVWKWGPDVGGNLWRTTGDISDRWTSLARIGFNQDKLFEFAKPGHWNDPDMLEIGNGGMTDDEYRTHMSLWAMLAAPLIAGNDVRDVKPTIMEILTNREVIAIDQDKGGKQAKRTSKTGDLETWERELADGSRAVAYFNLGTEAAKMTVKSATIHDVWSHTDFKNEHAVTIPPHGVVLVRLQ